MTAAFILSELQSVGTPEKAVHLSRFFKTGPGQYGEGDQFLGVVVPQTRSIAKANKATPFDELQLLLDSPWHEARLCALLILVYRFQDRKAMPEEREAIFRFYLKNMRRCNNWDLVDLTCRRIFGGQRSFPPLPFGGKREFMGTTDLDRLYVGIYPSE